MTNVRAFYGWKLIAVLSAAVSVNLGTAYVGAGVVNAAMAKDLHLTRGMLGLGSTILVLVMGLASPIAARIVNAAGARITLCAGSLMTALGSLLLALWVSNAWQYVVVYGGIVGIGASFGALIPAQACTSMWFKNKRGLAMSLVLAGSGLGGSISAPLLTRVISLANGNWRVAWYYVLGAALLVGLAALLFVKNQPADCGQLPDGGAGAPDLPRGSSSSRLSSVYRTVESWTVREAVRTPAFWLIGIAAVGESIPSTAAVVHAVPHLRDLGHSAAAAGAALGLFSICTIFGKLSAGFLCDRAEPRYAWSASIMLMGFAVYVATRAQTSPAMYLFVIMLGLGSGAALTCWHATVANYFGPTLFASVLGAQMPFSNAAAAATPFLVGLAYDAQHSYTVAFYVVAAISVGAAVPLLAAAPPSRKVIRQCPTPIETPQSHE
jgi:MFS family permease